MRRQWWITMRGTLIKWLYIPWVLMLFVIAVILALLEMLVRRKYPIGYR